MPQIDFIKLMRDEQAATAVEYGLIVGLIFMAIIAAAQGVAAPTLAMWGDVQEAVTTASMAAGA